MNSYHCPYCSMLNGEGKVWGSPIPAVNSTYPANDDKDGQVRMVKYYGDQIRITIDGDYLADDASNYIQLKNCPFCGRKL